MLALLVPCPVKLIERFSRKSDAARQAPRLICTSNSAATAANLQSLHCVNPEAEPQSSFFLHSKLRHTHRLLPVSSRLPQEEQYSAFSEAFSPQPGQKRSFSVQGAQSTHLKASTLYITSTTHLPHFSQRLKCALPSFSQASISSFSGEPEEYTPVIHPRAPEISQKKLYRFPPASFVTLYVAVFLFSIFLPFSVFVAARRAFRISASITLAVDFVGNS